MIRVGLISDTHGLLRPQAVAALAGCAHVIHGGDIGGESILRELERIAPLTVVRGNNDHQAWAEGIAEVATVTLAGVDFFVIHDLAELKRYPAAMSARVVVSGHSHKPLARAEGDRLFVNPGSAGPRRFKLPISVGVVEIDEGRVEARLIELPV